MCVCVCVLLSMWSTNVELKGQQAGFSSVFLPRDPGIELSSSDLPAGAFTELSGQPLNLLFCFHWWSPAFLYTYILTLSWSPVRKLAASWHIPTYTVSDNMYTAIKAPVRPEVHPDSVEELGRKAECCGLNMNCPQKGSCQQHSEVGLPSSEEVIGSWGWCFHLRKWLDHGCCLHLRKWLDHEGTAFISRFR